MKGYFTYDTSVIISRSLSKLPGQESAYLWSAVVLMELTAAARDDAQRKVFERLSREYARDNSLILPDESDWVLASKILFWLTRSRRESDGGKLRRLSKGASQRMALDTLIAVGAKRWNATLVVENWDDFKAIQYHCKGLRIIRSSDFFV